MTAAILQAKARLGLKWEAIATAAGLSPVFVTSACLGMNSLAPEAADRLAAVLDLGPEISAALQAFPLKTWDQAIPTDPVIYRFYEMIHVYGDTLKALIAEEFGDGIMSAGRWSPNTRPSAPCIAEEFGDGIHVRHRLHHARVTPA